MEIFQPSLSLTCEPDGEYTLDAVTIAPNSGYSAGRARPGVPASVRITPETFAVLLDIRVRRGRVLEVLTPIRHHLRNLKLGPQYAKTSVVAFAMIGDRIIGSSSLAVSAIRACPKNPTHIDTSHWYAWLNKMPPGPAAFHVAGVVHLPTPGYDTELVPASPQGINAAELILDLRVTPRPGIWPHIVTPVSVRYDQGPAGTQHQYQSVLIREPDGDAVQIEVEEVQ